MTTISQSYRRKALKQETAYEKVQKARDVNRAKGVDFVENIFDNFIEFHGDRLSGDDRALVGGIATLHGMPVTVLYQNKAKEAEKLPDTNYGMVSPDGYRKALRLMRQAEKFNRPIITFIDTPGAFPGIEAEEQGQGEAIAKNILEMLNFEVPIISVVTGEGSSGGALGIGVSNEIWMLEYSIYSILSPEGFASILFKDSKLAPQAAEKMKITSSDLLKFGIIDRIINEPFGGINDKSKESFKELGENLHEAILAYEKKSPAKIKNERREKYIAISGF